MNVSSKQKPKECVGVSQVHKWYRTERCLGEKGCSRKKSESLVRVRGKGSLLQRYNG